MKKIIISIYIFTILTINISAAADLSFQWERGFTLDNNLAQTGNVDQDEVMLSWEFEDNGLYTLDYFINENEKTTVEFNKSNDVVDVTFKISEDDPVNPGDDFLTDITTDYMSVGYMVWDNDQKKYIEPDPLPTEVTFTVKTSELSKGRVFKIENQDIKFRWDEQNSKFYYSTNSLNTSILHPFILSLNGTEKKRLDILKSIEFVANPAHYVNEGTVENKDYVRYAVGSSERPGSIPGLEIEITKPKKIDILNGSISNIDVATANKIDVTVNLREKDYEGIESPSFLQFKFNLDETSNMDITSDGKIGEYNYTADDKYKISVVKEDKAAIDPNFIEWDKLEGSTIYDPTEIIIQENSDAGIEFNVLYKPTSDLGFAYTYLKYKIMRKTIDSTFIVVTPYKGSGIYEVYKANTEVLDKDSIYFEKWVNHYVSSSKSNDIYIPVDVARSEMGDAFYTFKVNHMLNEESGKLGSQLLIYNANLDTVINPPIPEIRNIDNLKVVPAEVEGDDVKKVSFDLKFNIPKNLDQLLTSDIQKLWYELKLNTKSKDYTDPEDSNIKQNYQTAKVFYITRETDDFFITDIEGNKKEVDLSTGEYNVNVVLKDDVGWSNYLTEDWTGTSGNLMQPTAGNVSEYIEESSDPENDFFKSHIDNVPGIYFLSMKAIYDKDINDLSNELTQSDISMPQSLSLDETKENIPVTSNIEIENLENNSALLTWDEMELERYKRYMLDPLSIDIDSEDYEIFISKSKDVLDNFSDDQKFKDNEELIVTDYSNLNDLGEFDKITGKEYAEIEISDSDIDNLRNNEILMATIKTEKLNIKNIDSNEKYFVFFRNKLNLSQSAVPIESRFSKAGQVATFTTKDIPDGDLDIGVSPTIPKDFEVHGDITNTKLGLRWTEDTTNYENNEYVGYEIIKIPEKQILNEHKGKNNNIEDLINTGNYPDLVAYRIRKSNLEIYNNSTNLYEADTINEYVLEDGKHIFTDNTVTPNKIYYYYIRSLRNSDTDVILDNSFWTGLSVTTKPVKEPINLKYERGMNYSRDNFSEVVISFDAPILDDTLIPNDYEFKIAVKSKDDYVEDKTIEMIENTDEAPLGYKHYVYKVSDLKSGTKYNIKVRILDKTQGQLLDGTYPSSRFSNKIEARTEFDQQEQDNRQKFDEYVKYFNGKVEKIEKPLYWEIYSSDDDEEIIKYRYDLIKDEIINSSDNSFKLKDMKNEDIDKSEYYIPQKMMNLINKVEKNIIFENDEISVSFRPEMINENNESLKDIKDEIEDDDIKDFMYKFKINRYNKTSDIDNYDPITDKYKIYVDILGSKKTEREIEDIIVTKVEKVIKDETEEFIKDLEDEVNESKVEDEKLLELVNESIERIQKEIKKDVEDVIEDYEKEKEDIDELDKSLMFSLKKRMDNNSIIRGYYREGRSYEKRELLNNSFFEENKLNGYYVFAGKKYDRYEDFETQKIIDEYKIGDNIFRKENITRDTALNVISNILDNDLRNEGFSIPIYSDTDLIKKAEGYYYLIKTYEKLKNISMENVYIKDYSIFEKLKDVKEEYKNYIIKGIELDLIEKEEDFNDILHTDEFFEILKVIINKD